MISVVVFTLFSATNLAAEYLDEPREFETLKEMLDSLPQPVRIDPNVVTYSNGDDPWVPLDPMTYQRDQERQHALWKHVSKHCIPASTKTTATSECIAALTQYFDKEPIWKYSRLYYYSDPMGLLSTTYNEISQRHYELPYGYDDYSMEQIPRWGDIFDGQLEQRVALVAKVAQDPQCMELSSSSDVGIQEDKAEQCSAHEMYKYAAYLDACTTAQQRMAVLTSPTRSSKDKYKGLDRFETSKLVILEKFESAADRDAAQESVEKGLLHASWVIRHCSVNPVLLETARRNSRNSFSDIDWQATTLEDEEFVGMIKRTHDLALKIAAKSGDEWAIRSLPRLQGEFALDVFEKYPLLVHRHMGFDTGGISDQLEWNEQRHHRAKAYLLLKDLAGPAVAQREFDSSNLQEEIDYILNGGELTLPK